MMPMSKIMITCHIIIQRVMLVDQINPKANRRKNKILCHFAIDLMKIAARNRKLIEAMKDKMIQDPLLPMHLENLRKIRKSNHHLVATNPDMFLS